MFASLDYTFQPFRLFRMNMKILKFWIVSKINEFLKEKLLEILDELRITTNDYI